MLQTLINHSNVCYLTPCLWLPKFTAACWLTCEMNFRTGLESDCRLGHFIETKRVGARNTMMSFFFFMQKNQHRDVQRCKHACCQTRTYRHTYWRVPGCLSQNRVWVSGLARQVHISEVSLKKNSRSLDWEDHNVLTLKFKHMDMFLQHVQGTF